MNSNNIITSLSKTLVLISMLSVSFGSITGAYASEVTGNLSSNGFVAVTNTTDTTGVLTGTVTSGGSVTTGTITSNTSGGSSNSSGGSTGGGGVMSGSVVSGGVNNTVTSSANSGTENTRGNSFLASNTTNGSAFTDVTPRSSLAQNTGEVAVDTTVDAGITDTSNDTGNQPDVVAGTTDTSSQLASVGSLNLGNWFWIIALVILLAFAIYYIYRRNKEKDSNGRRF